MLFFDPTFSIPFFVLGPKERDHLGNLDGRPFFMFLLVTTVVVLKEGDVVSLPQRTPLFGPRLRSHQPPRIQTFFRRTLFRQSVPLVHDSTLSFLLGFNLGNYWFFLGILKSRFFDLHLLYTLIPAILLWGIVVDKFVGLVNFLKFLLALKTERIPLPNDLAHNVRLSHFGELVLVLVVLLARKLAIHLVHQIWSFLLSHCINCKAREILENLAVLTIF